MALNDSINKYNESKAKTAIDQGLTTAIGSVSAAQTMLNAYPVLMSYLDKLNFNTSVDVLFYILELLGVTKEDIIEFFAKLLAGNGADGLLNAIEQSVKAILLANIKKIFTCSFNPILPDDLMEHIYTEQFGSIGGKGIEIDLDAIDLYGTLNYCPTDNKAGQYFYFDNKTSLPPYYTPNTIWKSCDFNAYLWYVINKGQNVGPEANKLYWDNRVKYFWDGDYSLVKEYSYKFNTETPNKYGGYDSKIVYSPNYDINLRKRNSFFDTPPLTEKDIQIETDQSKKKVIEFTGSKTGSIPVYYLDDENKRIYAGIKKQQYIKCIYSERGRSKIRSNILRVYLNPYRYWHQRGVTVNVKYKKKKKEDTSTDTTPVPISGVATVSGGAILPEVTITPSETTTKEVLTLKLNKTIFEFNFDYIYSLKLFDSQVLCANIINAILGIASSFNFGLSIDLGGREGDGSRRNKNPNITKEIIAEKVNEIVNNIITQDDTQTTDCYFTFSNEEYNAMLEKAVKKHQGIYTYNDSQIPMSYEEITSILDNISNAATLNEKITAISGFYKDITAKYGSISGEYTNVEADETENNDGNTSRYRSPSISTTFDSNMLKNLLKETVTQICLQVLSPKVALLFKINSYVMGSLDPQEIHEEDKEGKFDMMDSFLSQFNNVITSMIIQIKDMIIQQLYDYVIGKLKLLIQLMMQQLILETIEYYKLLLLQLLNGLKALRNSLSSIYKDILSRFFTNYSDQSDLGYSTTTIGSGFNGQFTLDDVNYADIVPEQVGPDSTNKGSKNC